MTETASAAAFRSEHDLLGDRDVPAAVYWGVHTLRAVENFPITGQPLSSNMHLVRGLAAVKLAAARTNHELGLLDPERAHAIEAACTDVMNGKLNDQFVVDVIQGGA
ncbi:lyase family protein, partial [Arthrobacter sp. NPDC058288]|uniref:lyase family protein n=1 Tax=Arthrobacter sp. NPDC058288 TaxID=3346424 RepID=UPI0036E59CC5